MVRMCQVSTLACALVLVAGSVASADVKGGSTAGTYTGPNSPNEVVPGWSISGSAFSVLGDCRPCPGSTAIWDNGGYDGVAGIASHLGGATYNPGFSNGVKAADDFYLCEGFVYEIQSISATLITNSNPALQRACAELYDDCDGMPNHKLYTFNDFTKVDHGDNGLGFHIVDYTFTIANQNPLTNPGANRVLLKGGIYWLSVFGITDGQCQAIKQASCDNSFWGSTAFQKGSVPKKNIGLPTNDPTQFDFSGPWISIKDCCNGCYDLAFSVCYTPCKIILDNGFADLNNPGSPSQYAPGNNAFNSRSADDFVLAPCTTYNICYLEGCVYTNCDPTLFTGVFEIYSNACTSPSYAFGGSVLASGTANKVVDLHRSITDCTGQVLNAYRVEFHGLNFTLQGGHQYWVSIGINYAYQFTERAYFCYNTDDCRRDCHQTGAIGVHFNPGKYLPPLLQQLPPPNGPWVNANTITNCAAYPGGVLRDFSFLIAGNPIVSNAGASTTTTCKADFDQSGVVDVKDIFSFLQSWFTGCH